MKYNLSTVPESEFEHYVDLVKRSRDTRRKGVHANELEVLLVTEDYKEFDPFAKADKVKRVNDTVVGQAWSIYNSIWIKPGRPALETRVTILHEIAHLGEKSCAHGPKWRRVFGVAFAYYLREIGHSEEQVKNQIRERVVRRYRQYRRWSPQGTRNTWESYIKAVDTETEYIYNASRKVPR